jgi:hypothetical protein
LHAVGQAIDIRLPGRDLRSLRKVAVDLKGGGVGFYPKSDFVRVISAACAIGNSPDRQELRLSCFQSFGKTARELPKIEIVTRWFQPKNGQNRFELAPWSFGNDVA